MARKSNTNLDHIKQRLREGPRTSDLDLHCEVVILLSGLDENRRVGQRPAEDVGAGVDEPIEAVDEDAAEVLVDVTASQAATNFG